MENDDAGVPFEDARRRLAVTRSTLFNWIKAGKVGVIEDGRRGRGVKTMLNREDVERLSEERLKELRRKLSEAEG
ncbi:MAG: IS630 transposase-related protein [Armatimonadota bacterium]|nr:IS630 transposase-related protein [Armatimonadota bacterium]